jgi:hypothetical protein
MRPEHNVITTGRPFRVPCDPELQRSPYWTANICLWSLCSQADADGRVYASLEAIAQRLGLPLELLQYGVRVLEQADERSMFLDAFGRRVVRLQPHGWQLMRWQHYLEQS